MENNKGDKQLIVMASVALAIIAGLLGFSIFEILVSNDDGTSAGVGPLITLMLGGIPTLVEIIVSITMRKYYKKLSNIFLIVTALLWIILIATVTVTLQ